MKVNMGSADRTVRIILGVLFILSALIGWVSGVLAMVLVVLGIIFIGTAVIRFCPLYLPFGINTDKHR
jgi:hypothetical protein